MARRLTPQEIVESFLVRLRRIVGHSLIREQPELLERLHSGTMKMTVTVNNTTGDQSYLIRTEYPPEEAFESLASRVRPLIVDSDTLFYEKVLDALEQVVGAEVLNEWVDLPWWRKQWRTMLDGGAGPQAYQVGNGERSVTDRKLMYAWLYGDLVHAHPHRGLIAELSLDDRYRAAAAGIIRICGLAIGTADMIWHLHEQGLLTIDPEVMTVPVVVTNTVVEQEVRAYVAPVGTPMPDDLIHPDQSGWQTVHEALSETDAELRELRPSTDETPADDGDDDEAAS